MFDTSSLRAVGGALSMPATSPEKLLAQATSANDNTKIDKAATDFESILLGNWLHSAEESFAKVPGTDDDDADASDSGSDQYMDMAMTSLGSSLAASGGIGIGKMISKQLHKTEEEKTSSLPTDTKS